MSRTIASQISNAFHRSITGKNTQKPGGPSDEARSNWRISQGSDRKRQLGIPPLKVVNGIANTLEGPDSVSVFNLQTSDGTFFANGLLVHNCDATTQALLYMQKFKHHVSTIITGTDDDLSMRATSLNRR
jgi:hypothetical protein